MFDQGGTLIRLDGIITDVTDQIKSEEAMAHLAYHDYLTDLPNRRTFEEELDGLIKSSHLLNRQFAVLYFDMDGFKRINDTLGHLKGDQLLKEFQNDCKKTCRTAISYPEWGETNSPFSSATSRIEKIR